MNPSRGWGKKEGFKKCRVTLLYCRVPFSFSQTRILVTHGINYLSQCDQIVVMSGGRISEVGSYNELIDADGAFAEFIRVYSGVGEEEEEGAPSESCCRCGHDILLVGCPDL